MKIIVDSSEKLLKQKSWWVGMEMNCLDCGMKATLDFDDRRNVTHYFKGTEGERIEISCDCKCGGTLNGGCNKKEFDRRIEKAKIDNQEYDTNR